MIKSFSGQVVFCFAIPRAISAYVGENWLSQYIPLSHNSVQSHNSVHFLLYTCLTSLIKDSGSLHSALVVKSEICGKHRFLNETYLINDQNVNFSPIQMQHCIFDHTSYKFIQKSLSSCWCLVLSTVT